MVAQPRPRVMLPVVGVKFFFSKRSQQRNADRTQQALVQFADAHSACLALALLHRTRPWCFGKIAMHVSFSDHPGCVQPSSASAPLSDASGSGVAVPAVASSVAALVADE